MEKGCSASGRKVMEQRAQEIRKKTERETQQTAVIKDKVKAIDKLTDLDNTKRMLARGYVALENLTAANSVKQKNEIMQDRAKFETFKTLGENNQISATRAEI